MSRPQFLSLVWDRVVKNIKGNGNESFGGRIFVPWSLHL